MSAAQVLQHDTIPAPPPVLSLVPPAPAPSTDSELFAAAQVATPPRRAVRVPTVAELVDQWPAYMRADLTQDALAWLVKKKLDVTAPLSRKNAKKIAFAMRERWARRSRWDSECVALRDEHAFPVLPEIRHDGPWRAALDTLPTMERRVTWLLFWGGFGVARIARVLGLRCADDATRLKKRGIYLIAVAMGLLEMHGVLLP